jgi:hypothetical protein
MTTQMGDFAARQSRGGWTIARVPGGGNSRIHLLDDRGNRLRSLDLASSLPDFSRFAHWTTAGMSWSEPMLAYFTAGQRHFVVRAWWGARLVIALDQLRPLDPQELSDELRSTECELVSRGLRQLVAEIENGGQPRHDWPSTDVTHCTVATLAHFPGLLGLVEAVPLLRVLEERRVGGGECSCSFWYCPHSDRQLAQISLRRLGQKPRGYPALTFTESEERLPLRRPQPGPIDGRTRHKNLSQITRFTPLTEVYQLLGAPDEIGRGTGDDFWRYDVDEDPPCTVLLWLARDDSVTRIVKYLPPFWTGPDVFPSRTHSLLAADGTTVVAYINELDDGTFVGTRIEVNVLQELVSSGRYPLAPLAQEVLDGSYDAIGPLADALEEADDPRKHQICATRGVRAQVLP